MTETERAKYRKSLADLFLGYRAEWLDEDVFGLFTEPTYFPQLTTAHPCFLQGGRGTGKTTVLRCLSYEGQNVLGKAPQETPTGWPYYGMYYRVNTNRVRAFRGGELKAEQWSRAFGHYLNLEFCELILGFLEWYAGEDTKAPQLSRAALERVCVTLHLDGVATQADLMSALDSSKLGFEAAVNNVGDATNLPLMSLQGAPIDTLMEEVKKIPQFAGKLFFFLIDEYENFDQTQQRVVNTLIKHCGRLYSFKVGVKELGFRERSTVNEEERLVAPADFVLVNIAQELEGRFGEFAREVCNIRLKRAFGDRANVPHVGALLPDTTPETEALELGVGDIVAPVIRGLQRDRESGARFAKWCLNVEPLEVYILMRRAEAEQKTVAEKLREVLVNERRWKEQYENYKYSYLFTIREGRGGIRKHFAGWRVFCLLAAGNVRYLLELVYQTLTRHLDSGSDPAESAVMDVQTRAAQYTGQRNLRELEGLSLSGAKLTRLLLALGRVFQVMAAHPVGHTPEVNQFHLTGDIDDGEVRRRVEEILTSGIMHLALVRYVGSKLQEQTDMRDFDYAVHPIFAPFFVYSHRKKRKMELTDREFLGLVEHPTRGMREILERQRREIDEELPEQMKLFSVFYAIQDR